MNIFLRILSWLYGFGVLIRNLLFDEHLIHVYKPTIPTICVGNIAVGGTGKTPHVEYIVERLLREGYHVAVLSRGYKRKTRGFVLADQNATADLIGDEPRQIQLKYPSAHVAVCEDRARGIRKLQQLIPDLQVIILDDAFQHRHVRCGYYILLTQADRLYTTDNLMPLGRLREPQFAAHRADAIVVSKCPASMMPIERRVIGNQLNVAPCQSLYFSGIEYGVPQPLYPQLASPLSADTPHIFLLSGIAQPQYLRDYLGDRMVGELDFPDHHRFTESDLQRLLAESGNLPIITTEKDAVRLIDSGLVPEELRSRLYFLPIRVTMQTDVELFDQRLLRYVRENKK